MSSVVDKDLIRQELISENLAEAEDILDFKVTGQFDNSQTEYTDAKNSASVLESGTVCNGTTGTHWDTFISNNESSELFLGSSNTGGTVWNGYVSKFSSSTDNNPRSIDPGFSGCSRMDYGPCWSVIAGFDTGMVLQFNGNLEIVAKFTGHEKYITAVKRNKLEPNEFMSSSADGRIRVWNIETATPMREFANIHRGLVWDIDFKPDSSNLFASCGQDNLVVLRDKTSCLPVKKMLMLDEVPVTACLWSPANSNHLFCANGAGNIFSVDVRQPKAFMITLNVSESYIHRLREVNGCVAVINHSSRLYLLNPYKVSLCPVNYSADHRIRDVGMIGETMHSMGNGSTSFFAYPLTTTT